MGLTLAILAGAAVSVQFGATELTRRADAAPSPDPAPIIPVSATPLDRKNGYDVTRAFVGQIEPNKTVSISFELPGQLDEVLVDEGAQVAAGQTLARQDLSLLQAERGQLEASRSATKAQLKFAIQTTERRAELNKRGFTSQEGVDEAVARQDELRSRIAEIEAGLRNIDIRIGKSELRAPFDGRVTQRFVDGGETLGAGQPLMSLVKLSHPQVRFGVSLDVAEADLREALIKINGEELTARLVTLRPDIDPVTRTRTAIFETQATSAAFGQTAMLILRQKVPADGVWVPITSLKEGVRGQWTVMALDDENTVRAAVVEVLHAESTRVYVRTGLPDGALLIDEGPQRVTVGQRVQPTRSM
ncbi:efflux RND transporter periplasmic adaptor subunit [Litoreibacter ponti]|uniref:efflux RND transporter periplasmic adaptor subunit n=1 Tax=Litoreibacter ponti TaxID=1510457 RepID=UPI001304F3E5|nr:efflux RND transporter periplasmic adaptor subunit [Litoreibacter ponti]